MDGMNREKWLAMTRKQKLEHIWEYYKLHIAAALVVLLLAVPTVYHWLTYVEPQMSVIVTDLQEPMQGDGAFQDFLQSYGYEAYSNSVAINQNLHFDFNSQNMETVLGNGHYQEVLFGLLSVGDQDVLIANTTVFAYCIADGAMMDLRTVLSAELLEEHHSRLLFCKDSETGESYPCGVNLDGNRWMDALHTNYQGYVGILNNCDGKEIAADFIRFLLTQYDQEGT